MGSFGSTRSFGGGLPFAPRLGESPPDHLGNQATFELVQISRKDLYEKLFLRNGPCMSVCVCVYFLALLLIGCCWLFGCWSSVLLLFKVRQF